MIVDLRDPVVAALIEALGAHYKWGGGALSDGLRDWPAGPWDCSGFAQAALLRAGILRQGAWPDLTAHDLMRICDHVEEEEVVPGDLVFYGRSPEKATHVMVVLGATMVIGATGGGRMSDGADPRECVMAVPLHYRPGIVGCGRVPPLYRQTGE